MNYKQSPRTCTCRKCGSDRMRKAPTRPARTFLAYMMGLPLLVLVSSVIPYLGILFTLGCTMWAIGAWVVFMAQGERYIIYYCPTCKNKVEKRLSI